MQASAKASAQYRAGKPREFNGNHANLAEVQVRQRYAATPEQAFRAWLDPGLAGRWLFATAGRPVAGVSIDACVGGRFEVAISADACERGRYLDIQPGRQLAFSLAQTGSRRASKVVVEFSRRGAGCLLSLTHSGLPADQADHMEARWEGMLYGLYLLLDEAGEEPIAVRNPPARLRRAGPL